MNKQILLFFLLVTASINSFAITEYNKSVATIGVGVNLNASLSGNFKPVEKLTTNCLYNVLYFDATSDIGKAIYSTLLMAKAGRKKLSRIDYFQAQNGQICTLTYVEIAN